MHTDITQKEKPTGSVNYPAGHTDTGIVTEPDDAGSKAFTTLCARFALRGHALYCTRSVDGATTYYVERWGMVRCLPTLQDAAMLLALIGGQL